MVLTKSGVFAALLGGVLAVLHVSPGYLTARFIAGGQTAARWPGSTAELIVLSQGLIHTIGAVVGIAGVFVVGYWAGRRIALQDQYETVLLTFGLGGLIGYVTPVLLLAIYAVSVDSGALQSGMLGAAAVLFGSRAIVVTVQFAIVGFAGAAFAGLTADADAEWFTHIPSRSVE